VRQMKRSLPRLYTQRAMRAALGRLAVAFLVVVVFPASARAAISCTVLTTSINFGTTYNVFATTDTDSVATITYSCSGFSSTLPIRITLSAGHSTNILDRIFLGPDALHYNLYQDASHSVIWGDTVATDVDITIVKADRGKNLTVTIYGRVAALQDVRSGSYSDTVTVSVIY
jgi:spore coat protein U-like protein